MSNNLPAPQPTPPPQPKVIAAIPCYNEGRFIGEVVRKAKKYVDQVIVIDDGSHDGTAEAAKVGGFGSLLDCGMRSIPKGKYGKRLKARAGHG